MVFPCLRPHTRATFASGGVEMATQLTNEKRLKGGVKSAIVEVLEERKDLVREVIEEDLEDAALARAIEDGDRTGIVNREEIRQSSLVVFVIFFRLKLTAVLRVFPLRSADSRERDSMKSLLQRRRNYELHGVLRGRFRARS